MTIPEISAAVTSVRTMADIFKGMLGLHVDSQVKDMLIDAQNVTLQLQSQMFDVMAKFEAQADELRELREKLRQKEDWNLTAAKYVLCQTEHGNFMYRLKSPQTPADRASEFCAFCFGKNKIVLLQNRYCHECQQGI